MGTLRRCHSGTAPSITGTRLGPALSILRQELQRFPPLSRLAKACGMSPRHLQRSFHEPFGFGPRTYWMKCRIRAACAALREAGRSIAEVSTDLGFCDQSNFTLHFRRHTGTTPAAYIRQPAGSPLKNPVSKTKKPVIRAGAATRPATAALSPTTAACPCRKP
jgi:transcriptional regulator GlxA family with amidase domain